MIRKLLEALRRRRAPLVKLGEHRQVIRPRKQFEVLCDREVRL
jgi:hypothetical protein